MVLNASDYVGDMSLLGVHDWAESTCFYFPKPDPEPTEIRVTAKVHEFVVVLQVLSLLAVLVQKYKYLRLRPSSTKHTGTTL
jgi:hypothetical protein